MHMYSFTPTWQLPGKLPRHVPLVDWRGESARKKSPPHVGWVTIYEDPDPEKLEQGTYAYVFDCSTELPDGCEFSVKVVRENHMSFDREDPDTPGAVETVRERVASVGWHQQVF